MIEIEPENCVHSNQSNETSSVSQETACDLPSKVLGVETDALLDHGTSVHSFAFYEENEENIYGMEINKALGVNVEETIVPNFETTRNIDNFIQSTELFQQGNDTACPKTLDVSGTTDKMEKDHAIINSDKINQIELQQIDKNIKKSTVLEIGDVINVVKVGEQTEGSEEDDNVEDDDSQISDFPFSETYLFFITSYAKVNYYQRKMKKPHKT